MTCSITLSSISEHMAGLRLYLASKYFLNPVRVAPKRIEKGREGRGKNEGEETGLFYLVEDSVI